MDERPIPDGRPSPRHPLLVTPSDVVAHTPASDTVPRLRPVTLDVVTARPVGEQDVPTPFPPPGVVFVVAGQDKGPVPAFTVQTRLGPAVATVTLAARPPPPDVPDRRRTRPDTAEIRRHSADLPTEATTRRPSVAGPVRHVTPCATPQTVGRPRHAVAPYKVPAGGLPRQAVP